MSISSEEVIAKLNLSPKERASIDARTFELIAQELTLRQLRRARKLTQVRLAKALGVGQDGVSKLEQRADLMLSTLRKTVAAMGGSLTLVATFPDRAPVRLIGFGTIEPEDEEVKPARHKAAPAAPKLAGAPHTTQRKTRRTKAA